MNRSLEVTGDLALQMAEQLDIAHFECSCKQNINIQEVFITLARLIQKQKEEKEKMGEADDTKEWGKDISLRKDDGTKEKCQQC